MFFNVGFRRVHRFLQHRADVVAEPGFKAEMEIKTGKQADEYSGRDGKNAEQSHHPDLQPRSRRTGAAVNPKPNQAFGDNGAQKQH